MKFFSSKLLKKIIFLLSMLITIGGAVSFFICIFLGIREFENGNIVEGFCYVLVPLFITIIGAYSWSEVTDGEGFI